MVALLTLPPLICTAALVWLRAWASSLYWLARWAGMSANARSPALARRTKSPASSNAFHCAKSASCMPLAWARACARACASATLPA
ncbi:hypothetical protein D3C72_1137980 [compost metagenome]